MSSFITFKQYLIIAERFNILLEGRIQDDVYRILTKGGYAEEQLPDVYNQLNDIVARYNTQKHLPMLAKYFIEEGPDTSVISSYYDRFMTNPKLRDLDIFQFKTFRDFEHKIDSTATPVNKQAVEEISDKPIYEDENVKIYYGSDKNRCIKYGQGRRFGFCISRDDHSNLFHSYRGNKATFYFVYFKNDTAQAGAPAELIVLHAYSNGKYMINYAEPNEDVNITLDEIEDRFPVLVGLVGPDSIVRPQALTEDERRQNNVRKALSLFDLRTKDEQLMWLELRSDRALISQSDFAKFDEDHVLKYIEAWYADLPRDVLRKHLKHMKRYKAKRLQYLDMLLNNNEYNIYLTPDMLLLDKRASAEVFDKLSDPSSIFRADERYTYFLDKYTVSKIATNHIYGVLYSKYASLDKNAIKAYIDKLVVKVSAPAVLFDVIKDTPELSQYYDSMRISAFRSMIDSCENSNGVSFPYIAPTMVEQSPDAVVAVMKDVKYVGTAFDLIQGMPGRENIDTESMQRAIHSMLSSIEANTYDAMDEISLYGTFHDLLHATFDYVLITNIFIAIQEIFSAAEHRHENLNSYIAHNDGYDVIKRYYLDGNSKWSWDTLYKAIDGEFGLYEIPSKPFIPGVDSATHNLFFCIVNNKYIQRVYETYGDRRFSSKVSKLKSDKLRESPFDLPFKSVDFYGDGIIKYLGDGVGAHSGRRNLFANTLRHIDANRGKHRVFNMVDLDDEFRKAVDYLNSLL